MKTKEKRFLITVYALLLATIMLSVLPTEAEAEIYEDTVRLHILANSDSEEDQQLKLKIRDRLLLKYGEYLQEESCAEGAAQKLEVLLEEIEGSVEGWLKEYGSAYSAKVTLTKEWYETREYDDFTLPKGIYKSLKIIIGKGEGKNWWCVMYPPLCTSIATEKAPADDNSYSKEEVLLIRGKKYTVKFKILEILSEAFTKNG